MSASDTLMPSSEQTNTPQTYKIDIGSDAKFSKVRDSKTTQEQSPRFQDAENVDVTPSSKLIGLTKEQLEQYRNDPFWKSVRLVRVRVWQA